MKNQLQRFIALFVLLFFLGIPSYAQSEKLDELKYELQNSKEDTSRVHLLIKICSEIHNAEERLYYARRATKLSQKLNFKVGYSISKLEEGKALLSTEKLEEALNCIHVSLKLFQKNDNTRYQGQALLHAGQCHDKLNDLDSAFYYLKATLDLSEEMGYSDLAADANYFMGNLYNDLGENIKAISQLLKSQEYYESIQSRKKLWHTLNSLGVTYDDIGNYPEALKSYIRALEITTELEDSKGQVMVMNNMASFYYQIGKYDHSLKLYDEALDLFVGSNNPEEEWIILNNKAQIYTEMKDTLSALIHLRKAYDIVVKLDDQCELLYVLDGIANIMSGQGKLDSAKVCYSQAISLVKTCNNRLVKAVLLRGLGDVYLKEKKFRKGEGLLLESVKICEESSYPKELEKASYILYMHYKNRGMISNALRSFEKYSAARDSLFNNDANMEISKISSEFEFKKELHKMEYKKQAEELKLKSELDKEASNKNVLLLVLILTVLLAATLVRSYFLLQSHNRRLESLNEEKNTLMGVVAHDLRSPLNNITGLISLMKNDSSFINASKDNQKYFSLLSETTFHMREMIDKVLDINAIEEMKLNINMLKYDLGKILNTVSSSFLFLANKKDIKIHVDAEEQKYYSNVDKNYTMQIFDNLLSNAIKFSQSNRNVYLKIEEFEGQIIISVKDEGPGLSEQDVAKLFTKYQKLGAKPTGNEESIGLGLSIVKKFVDAMEGEITCSSQLGLGTTFTVKFQAS